MADLCLELFPQAPWAHGPELPSHEQCHHLKVSTRSPQPRPLVVPEKKGRELAQCLYKQTMTKLFKGSASLRVLNSSLFDSIYHLQIYDVIFTSTLVTI